MKIHFLGVGKMGLPMARHLQAAGHTLTVEDPAPATLGQAVQAGLSVGSEQTLVQADVVMSSLPHDAALLAVGERVARLLQGRKESGGVAPVYLDTSTVSVAASAQVAQACQSAGVDYLRATVSGNNHMAEAAQLTVMASGPQAVHERLLPLLRCWGPNHFYLGNAEQARLMKLVVNLMIAQTSAMLSEALTLGQKGGLAWGDMWQVITASAVASPIVKAKSVQLGQRDFSPTFTVLQMMKDLDLILGEAHALQVPLAQTAHTRQLMNAAAALGCAQEDYAAIIKAVEQNAGWQP
jgi:3-hydroxyisobutyrate dehydrogenase-like beta-hydroxyacid dehydrogenase